MAFIIGNIFDARYLESLAISETGRMAAGLAVPADKLHVYPSSLLAGDILCQADRSGRYRDYYLCLGKDRRDRVDNPVSLLRYIFNLRKYLAICGSIDIYLMSLRDDLSWALISAVVARFMGRSVILHDYSFKRGPVSRSERILYSLADRHILAGELAEGGFPGREAPVSSRLFEIDRTAYSSFRKTRAVPRVLVYGDFKRSSVCALVSKALELTKVKYPRTEFTFICPLKEANPGISYQFFNMVTFRNEGELQAIYKECDMLLLASPQGLNRYFAQRATYAGYPIVTNGLDIATGVDGSRLRAVGVRNSYSSMADEIIRLVEDDDYYRSFG